jgi:hypothetical protein
VYRFCLDTIPGQGDPLVGGADYSIQYNVPHVTILNNGIEEVHLEFYDPINEGWYPAECEGVEAASLDCNIEVSVPWSCIAGEDCFNAIFGSEYLGREKTDWAPDREGDDPVTVAYCICEPPVAGELVGNRFPAITPQIVMAISLVTIGLGVAFKKQVPYK